MTSKVWKYFIALDPETAQCLVCQKVYSRKGRGTSSLRNHLKSMHMEKFCELIDVEKNKFALQNSISITPSKNDAETSKQESKELKDFPSQDSKYDETQNNLLCLPGYSESSESLFTGLSSTQNCQNPSLSSMHVNSNPEDVHDSGIASPGRYLLRKSSHCTSILDQMIKDEAYCDVTLTAEGQNIKAHKIVLCLASTYFKQVLNTEPSVKNVIVFRDIKYLELKKLITFIYTGEVTIDVTEFESFMRTAEMLQLGSLCDKKKEEECPNEKSENNSKPPTKRSKKSSAASRPAKSRKITDSFTLKPPTVPFQTPVTRCEEPLIPTPEIKSEPADEEHSLYPGDFLHDDDAGGGGGGNDLDMAELQSSLLDSLPPGKCPFCPNSETRLGSDLSEHLVVCHPEKNVLCCENCAKVFKSDATFEHHVDTCRNITTTDSYSES